MRKLIILGAVTALTATTAIMSNFAQAAMKPPSSMEAAVAELNGVEKARHYMFEGRRHCWYYRGWNGPGWYWCGYHRRHGHGWGGGDGWNGWRYR